MKIKVAKLAPPTDELNEWYAELNEEAKRRVWYLITEEIRRGHTKKVVSIGAPVHIKEDS